MGERIQNALEFCGRDVSYSVSSLLLRLTVQCCYSRSVCTVFLLPVSQHLKSVYTLTEGNLTLQSIQHLALMLLVKI